LAFNSFFVDTDIDNPDALEKTEFSFNSFFVDTDLKHLGFRWDPATFNSFFVDTAPPGSLINVGNVDLSIHSLLIHMSLGTPASQE